MSRRDEIVILAGDIDITESSLKNMYPEIIEGYSRQVYTPPQLGTYYYARLITQKGPTADSRVRLALSMTIDRRLMAKVLGTGENRPRHFTPDVTAGFARSFTV